MKNEYAILTDFYELTMADGYIVNNIADKPAVFDMFFREAPFNGVYAICYGLNRALQDIANMTFTDEIINYLNETDTFSDRFLEYLANWECELTIRAIDDGRIVFPYEPIAEIEGSLLQCQIIETYLLNCFNFPTLCATKANRMWLAAEGDPIIEFGLRRSQGPDGGITATEAAMAGGCEGTSNVLGGKKIGVTATGTQAHSWIQAFDTELEAFRAYAKAFPDTSILLVDTYDTLESGIPNAIKVGKELEEKGHDFVGIRLDSGDLAYLSKKARKMLDDAGLEDAKIVVSNQIDEHVIKEIKSKGGKVDIWGIGTKLVTCYDDPALGGVYKLVELDGKPKLKISDNIKKATIPSKKRLFRLYNKKGKMTGDIIQLYENKEFEGGKVYDPTNPLFSYEVTDPDKIESLLKLKMKDGELTEKPRTWKDAQDIMKNEMKNLQEGSKRFLNPHLYKVSISESLFELRKQIMESH
ncbi:MAG: nicotinate phosphoribosyltransferase [Promethearchaeia archaeon]